MTTREFRQFPRYNAAADLIERNANRGGKVAVIDADGSHSYFELAERVHRCANALREFGVEREQRVLLCLFDSIDFHACFLGAILAGVVPIPVNTLLTEADYAFILADSRPQAAIVSAARMPALLEGARLADWRGRFIVAGKGDGAYPVLADLSTLASSASAVAPTRPEDVCFWLYSSGSTGDPKAVMHLQTSLIQTAERFGAGILGITERDIVYSAAKLFFAYGLGNALSFTMSAGATSVLLPGRPTPPAVNAILRTQRPTIFCGVPTLFNSLLASADLPHAGEHALRLCTSAGEALPERLGRSWKQHTGVDIVDGIGSTEMLHIFVSNRPGSVRYGRTGRPVPGYRVRLVDDSGLDVAPGEVGEMLVSGPSAAAGYWGHADKTRTTFLGEWVRTGDKFRETPEGDFVYCGRRDEMLKVSGNWVSPMEVEAALMAHDTVFEAAVVGRADESGLVKPLAFVVLRPDVAAEPLLAEALQDFVKTRLAPYKYPRWIEFIEALPKTATGKIQRFVLQKRANAAHTEVARPG